jgi:hypothetical protein
MAAWQGGVPAEPGRAGAAVVAGGWDPPEGAGVWERTGAPGAAGGFVAAGLGGVSLPTAVQRMQRPQVASQNPGPIQL